MGHTPVHVPSEVLTTVCCHGSYVQECSVGELKCGSREQRAKNWVSNRVIVGTVLYSISVRSLHLIDKFINSGEVFIVQSNHALRS